MLQLFDHSTPQHPPLSPPPHAPTPTMQTNSPPRSPPSLPPSAPSPPPRPRSPPATTHAFPPPHHHHHHHHHHHAHSSSQSPADPIPPLNSPLRTTPIHPALPRLKTSDPTHHPLHCRPLTQPELAAQKTLVSALKKVYPTPDAARKAQDEKAKEILARMEENERKRGEIEKEERERVAQWGMERKIFGKFVAGRGRRDEDGGTDGGSGAGDKMEMS